MKNTLALIALLALALPAAAGASQTASTPTPQPTATPAPFFFTPPSGWTKRDTTMSMGGMNIVGMWASPLAGTTGENINIGTQTTAAQALDDYMKMTSTQMEQLVGAGNIHDNKAEKLCNGKQNGWFLSSTLSFGAKTMNVEQTYTLNGNTAYVVTYTRLSTASENPDARKALDSICIGSRAST